MFLFFFLLLNFFLFFSWPGKWTDRVTLPPFSRFIVFRAVVFKKIYSLRLFFLLLLFHSEWGFFVLFCKCVENLFIVRPYFLCKRHSHRPGKLQQTIEQRNKCTNEKENKVREDRGEKQTHNERKGYLGREEFGVWWVKVDRSGLSSLQWQSYLFCFHHRNEKTTERVNERRDGERDAFICQWKTCLCFCQWERCRVYTESLSVFAS